MRLSSSWSSWSVSCRHCDAFNSRICDSVRSRAEMRFRPPLGSACGSFEVPLLDEGNMLGRDDMLDRRPRERD